jgi:putative membrane protein
MKKLHSINVILIQGLWIGAYFILLKRDGDLPLAVKFLNPKYLWLLFMSVGFFIAFLIVSLKRLATGVNLETGIYKLLFLMLPLVALPLALEAELGAKTLDRRGIESTFAAPASPAEKENDSSESLVLPDLSVPETTLREGVIPISEILSQKKNYLGKDVEVIGKASLSPDVLGSRFYLYRFLVFCCTADASPAGFIISGYDSRLIEPDGWYKVTGRVTYSEVEEKPYLTIDASDVKPVEEPESVYEFIQPW